MCIVEKKRVNMHFNSRLWPERKVLQEIFSSPSDCCTTHKGKKQQDLTDGDVTQAFLHMQVTFGGVFLCVQHTVSVCVCVCVWYV